MIEASNTPATKSVIPSASSSTEASNGSNTVNSANTPTDTSNKIQFVLH